MTIQIKINEYDSYEIWDHNGLICDCLKKEEVGEALHRWLCIPTDAEQLNPRPEFYIKNNQGSTPLPPQPIEEVQTND